MSVARTRVRLQDVWSDKVEIAYCWRSGLIGFGQFLPAGTLPITNYHDRQKLKDACEGNARWSYPPNPMPLVPGIPEAKTDNEALAALNIFSERVREALFRSGPRKK